MKNNERIAQPVDKSLSSLLELLFAPEFYNGFNPKNFPPYNIIKVSNDDSEGSDPVLYRIDIAVAGYHRSRISVSICDNILNVIAHDDDLGEPHEIVYRGISNRSFRLKFKLNSGVVVDRTVMRDGILSIGLKKENCQKITEIEIE